MRDGAQRAISKMKTAEVLILGVCVVAMLASLYNRAANLVIAFGFAAIITFLTSDNDEQPPRRSLPTTPAQSTTFTQTTNVPSSPTPRRRAQPTPAASRQPPALLTFRPMPSPYDIANLGPVRDFEVLDEDGHPISAMSMSPTQMLQWARRQD